MSQDYAVSEARASDFLSSLAVNTKGSGASSGYANASLVISSLEYIGVTTVRDSYVPYEQGNAVISAMAASGVKFDFVVKNGVATAGQSGIDSFIANLKAFTADHPGSVVAVEGLNEANVESFSYLGGSDLAAAAAFQKDLYTAIKADPALSGVVVYNMTLANYDPATYAQLGDLGAYSDAANSHAYVGNGSNLDGRMEGMFALAQGASSGDPLVVTETGYTTLASTASVGVSETAQSILALKSVLLAYENGSTQTYLYELFDEPYAASRGLSETQFGLFYADGTPKPAAVALHNLTTILSYGDTGGAHAGFSLDFSLSGAPANTHVMVLTKSGETSDLVVWVDTPVWSQTNQVDVNVPPTTVTVDLGGIQSSVRVYDPLKGLDPIAVYENVSSIQLPIGADPLVIEIGAASAVRESTVVTPASLTLTAADFMAQIDTLAHSTTLTSVTLTDSHVLSVATPETMAYIIANYGDVLSKISGGYSFVIPRPHANWRTDTTYDANGVFVSRLTSGQIEGQFVKTMISYADGSYETFNYAGNDPSHPIEHYVFNASGTQILLERFNADGSDAYTQALNPDGSVLAVNYDSTGRKVAQQVNAADGTKVYASYDAASGQVTQQRTVFADGHSEVLNYSAGVLTQKAVVNLDGTIDYYGYKSGTTISSHQKVDASGVVLDLERFNADGSLSYTEARSPDGALKFVTYDSTGRKLSQQVNAADGTKVYTNYDAASGQVTQQRTVFTDGHSEVLNYTVGMLTQKVVVGANGVSDYYSYFGGTTVVSSHQTVDANGTVLLLERFNADGSLSYTEARSTDGALKLVTYDSTGRKLSEQVNAADGTKVYTSYDAGSGQLTQQRTVFTDSHSEVLNYTAGVLTQKVVVGANGVSDYYNYFSGKTVVSSHQTVDANGTVLLLERFNADGSYAYSEARKPDGSAVFVTYDTSGRKVSQQTNQADGTKVYLTYNAASGVLTQQRSVFTDGHSEVLNYNTSGVLTQKVVVNTDTIDYYSYFSGTTVVSTRQKVDAAGKVVLIERFRSDGTFSSSEAYNKDGSAVYVNYDTSGRKISQQTNQADGTKVYLTFNVTSGVLTQQRSVFTDGHSEVLNYNTSGVLTQKVVVNTDMTIDYYSYYAGTTVVSSRQKVDSAGKVLLIERFRSDGTFSSSEAYNKDGSAVFVTYDTGGHKISQQTNQADGTKVYLTYSAATGLVTQQRSVFTDGHSEVLNYNTSGVLMQKVVVNADATIDYYSYYAGTTVVSSRQKVDSAGKVLLIERFRSDGTFSSSEAYNKDGSAVFVTYDTGGHKISQQTNHADGTKEYIAYSATTGVATQQRSVFTDGHTEVLNYNSTGVLTQKVVVAADGSSDYYTYANGSTVPTEHQKLTSSGVVVLIERFRTDGTYISSEATKPDGSFVYVTYDSTGRKVAQQTNLPDGTKVTINFDAATGVATQQQTVYTDGHSEVLTYTTVGVLTQKAVVNTDMTIDYYSYASGSTVVTSHQKVDPSGTVLLLEKFRSDGTYISSEAHNPDGSTVYVSYDSTGHKIGQQANAADGTVTNVTYDASSGLMTQMRVAYTDGHVVVNTYSSGVLTRETVSNPDSSIDYYSFTAGQSTATSHQKVDASGTVTLIERFNSDGSYSYSEAHNADGSTVIANFDTTGHKLAQTTYTATATKVDTFLQDGSGDINHNTYAKNGALLSSDVEHGNGTHTVYYYTDGLSLHGGTGDDAFYFGSTNTANAYYDGGHDLVYTFNASTDHILIASSFASNMSGLHISQTGSDVTINMDADHSIVLKNTQVSSLTDGVFAFV
ncbi:hypothetical protein [Xanthobacter autotrophicus]|uniref:hypothetical protein n=1 Tax=Xanthobacter autotrophicus TaxID=280 RepID=UPI00372B3742